MKFFAYGSLIFEEVIFAVTGEYPTALEATLDGYARYRLSNESYPGIVQSAGGTVDGVLYNSVSEEAFKKLDRFEGEFYERRQVTVTVQSNNGIRTYTYIIRKQFESLLSKKPWNKRDFQENSLVPFLKGYPGFH